MNQTIRLVLSGILWVLAQVLLFNYFNLGYVATPYPYMLFILLLPTLVPRFGILLTAFGLGIAVDIFSQTYGLHAFCCVLIAGFRFFWLNLLTPESRGTEGLDLRRQPILWLILYFSLPVFIHHLAFFFLEGQLNARFWGVLVKSVASSVYTLAIGVALVAIFYKRS